MPVRKRSSRAIRSGSPPADPNEPVLVPGDPERIAREERLRTGIAVDAITWEDILQAGEKVGLPRAEATP